MIGSKKIWSLLIVMMMVIQTASIGVFAQNTDSIYNNSTVISEITPLAEDIATQTFDVGDTDTPILPEYLSVVLTHTAWNEEQGVNDDGEPQTTWTSNNTVEEAEIAVTWSLSDDAVFSTDAVTTYTYTATTAEYTAVGVAMPEITVNVQEGIVPPVVTEPQFAPQPRVVTLYDVWVSGVQVTSDNMNDVLGDVDGASATVTYTPGVGDAPGTLTLNGANIDSYYKSSYSSEAAIFTNISLDIKLENENTITRSTGGIDTFYGIYLYPHDGTTASVTIKGDDRNDKLAINSDVPDVAGDSADKINAIAGIRAVAPESSILIEDCTIDIDFIVSEVSLLSRVGVHTSHEEIIVDNAELNFNDMSVGIHADTYIEIVDSELNFANMSNAIKAVQDYISVTNSTLDIDAEMTAISAEMSATIIDSVLDITYGASGIYVRDRDNLDVKATISNSELELVNTTGYSSTSYAISINNYGASQLNTTIEIKDNSSVKINTVDRLFDATTQVNVMDSTVVANAEGTAINSDSLSFTNSLIDISSANGFIMHAENENIPTMNVNGGSVTFETGSSGLFAYEFIDGIVTTDIAIKIAATAPDAVPEDNFDNTYHLNSVRYMHLSDSYGVWVDGKEVTPTNQGDVLGNGTVSYIPSVGSQPATLVLDNANIDEYYEFTNESGILLRAGIYSKHDLEIEIKNDSNITIDDSATTEQAHMLSAVLLEETLSMSADGELGVSVVSNNADNTSAICADTMLVENGASIIATVKGGDRIQAVDVMGNLEVNDASLSVTARETSENAYGATAIEVDGSFTINGEKSIVEVSVIDGGEDNYGVYVNDSLRFNNGILTATVEGGFDATGINVFGDFTFAEGTLTASADSVGEYQRAIGKSPTIQNEAKTTIVASGNSDGSNSVPSYDSNNINDYKYVGITTINKFPVWVSGIQVTDKNLNDVLGIADLANSTNLVAYTPATSTETAKLTLVNADITGYYDLYDPSLNRVFSGIYSTEDLEIVLIGTNTVDISDMGSANIPEMNAAIFIDASLDISGTGELTAIAGKAKGNSVGIYTTGDFSNDVDNVVNAIAADADMASVGIKTDGELYLSDGTITAISGVAPASSALEKDPVWGSPVYLIASTNSDGSNPEDYDKSKLSTYKYLKIEHMVTYPVVVGGVLVTEKNQDDVLGDGTVKYIPQQYGPATLILKDANITDYYVAREIAGSAHYGIYVTQETVIELNGTNTVDISNIGSAELPDASGALSASRANLYIVGDGTLVATSGDANYESCAINSDVMLGISADVTAIAGTAELSVGIGAERLYIDEASVLATGGEAEGESYGVYSYGQDPLLNVNEGSLIANSIANTAVVAQAITAKPNVSNAVVIKGSTNSNGENSVDFIEVDMLTYKYVNIFAPKLYPVWVGGIQVTEINKNDVLSTLDGDAATVVYVPEVYDDDGNSVSKAKLILNNANINDYYVDIDGNDITHSGIYADMTIEIELIGTNTIDISNIGGASLPQYSRAIDIDGTNQSSALTIQGEGVLTAKSGDAEEESIAIYVDDDYIMNSGTVTAISGETQEDSYGVFIEDDVDIYGGKIIATAGKATDESYGVYIGDDLDMFDGYVSGNGGAGDNKSCGIYIDSTTDILGGEVIAKGGNAAKSYGMLADSGFDLENGAKLTATGGDATDSSYGLLADSSFEVYDAVLVAKGGQADDSYGIYVNSAFFFSKGSVHAESATANNSSYGCYFNSTFEMDYGDLVANAGNATDSSCGIEVGSGMNVNAGKITATGGEADYSYGLTINNTSIELLGGQVIATGGSADTDSYGLYSLEADINVNGGKITATGGEAGSESYGIHNDSAVYFGVKMGHVTAKTTATGASVAQAVFGAPNTINVNSSIIASTNADGSNPVGSYDEENIDTYKYLYIHSLVQYPVWIGGIQVDENNMDDVLGSADQGATVVFAPSFGNNADKIILNGANITDYYINSDGYQAGIYSEKIIDIETVGTNSVNISDIGNEETPNTSCAIYAESEGGLIISGNGKLDVFAGDSLDTSAGILSNGDFILNSGTLTALGAKADYSYGVFADSDLVINDGELVATGGDAEDNSYGVFADSDVVINDGELVATGGDAEGYSYGVFAYSDLEVNDGDITAIGGTASERSYGIYVYNDLEVNDGDITAIGGTASERSYGIFVYFDLYVYGGDITATGGAGSDYSYGIYIDEYTDIEGGSITATGGAAKSYSYGIYANYSLDVYDGNITTIAGTAESYSYGIYVYDDLDVYGGDITATAGTASEESYGIRADEFNLNGGTVNTKSLDANGRSVYEKINLSDGNWIITDNNTNQTVLLDSDYHLLQNITVFLEVIDDGGEDDNTGDDNTGDDNTGDDNTGDDNTGDDNTGDDNTGDNNTGDNNTGDNNTGDNNTGDNNTGGNNTGGNNTGDDNTGDDNIDDDVDEDIDDEDASGEDEDAGEDATPEEDGTESSQTDSDLGDGEVAKTTVTPDGDVSIRVEDSDGSATITDTLPEKVMVGDRELDSTDYKVENGELVINAEVFEEFEDGTYDITVEYEGVTLTTTVIVEDGVPTSFGPTVKTITEEESSNSAPMVVLFVAIVAIVVIGGVAAFVMLKKRSNSNE